MKKMLVALSLFVCVGILSGCGEKERTIECTLSQKTTSYELKSTYKIFATGEVVDKVETVETATSEQDSILDTLKETLDEQYASQQELYGGYTYDVTKTDSKVESKVTIDYSKVDMDKLASDNTAIKKFVDKNNRLTVDGAVAIYEGLGAVCEK